MESLAIPTRWMQVYGHPICIYGFTRADDAGAWKVMVRRSDDHLTADCGPLLAAAINLSRSLNVLHVWINGETSRLSSQLSLGHITTASSKWPATQLSISFALRLCRLDHWWTLTTAHEWITLVQVFFSLFRVFGKRSITMLANIYVI